MEGRLGYSLQIPDIPIINDLSFDEESKLVYLNKMTLFEDTCTEPTDYTLIIERDEEELEEEKLLKLISKMETSQISSTVHSLFRPDIFTRYNTSCK